MTEKHKVDTRLDQRTFNSWRKKLHDHDKKADPLLREWIKEWLNDPAFVPVPPVARPSVDVRRLLAESIRDHLVQNTEWITDAVVDTLRAHVSAGSIFGDRFNHFLEEKRFLARRFAPWLLDRITHYQRQGRTVYLCVDSGTSLYFVMEEVTKQLLKRVETESLWKGLVLLTNNWAGFTCYLEISGRNPFTPPGSSKRVELASYIPSRLVGGLLQKTYLALIGADAISMLEHTKAEAIKDDNPIFIGLLAGNWIRVINRDSRCPIPMVRDSAQADFKRALVDVCDELFVLSPLGKIFLHDVSQDRAVFRADDGEEFHYQDVDIKDGKENCVKLVSTSRPEQALLYNHAEMLKIIHTGVTERFSPNFSDPAEAILKIPAVLLDFDGTMHRSSEEQIGIEFPHRYSQAPEFMKKYFSVSTKKSASEGA